MENKEELQARLKSTEKRQGLAIWSFQAIFKPLLVSPWRQVAQNKKNSLLRVEYQK